MKNLAITIIFAGLFMSARAQLTSSDIRDAAASGPFPIYIGSSITYSHKPYKNYSNLRQEFTDYYTNKRDGKGRRIAGLQALIGVSLIPERWNIPVAFALEARYIHLERTTRIQPQTFTLVTNAITATAGLRYSLFPFTLQAHAGPVIYHNQEYAFKNINRSIRTINDEKLFDDWNFIGRITLLDPAGTEGGWGFFFEVGHLMLRNESSDLAPIVRVFNEEFQGQLLSKPAFWYSSFGMVVPLALRIK